MPRRNSQTDSAQASRDDLLRRIMDHCFGIPDAKEVFLLLTTIEGLGGISQDEAVRMMKAYWE